MSSFRLKQLLGWLLAATTLVLTNYAIDFQQIKRSEYQTKAQDIAFTAAIFQSQLEFLLGEQQFNQIQKSVAELGALKHVAHVYFLNEQMTILAANQIAAVGEPLSSEVEQLKYQQIERQFINTNQQMKAQLWWANDNADLYFITPVTLGRQIGATVRSNKMGALLIHIDMTWVDDFAHFSVQELLWYKIGYTLLIISALSWFCSGQVVSRLRQFIGPDHKRKYDDEFEQLADVINQRVADFNRQKALYQQRLERMAKTLELSKTGSWDLDLETQQLYWSEEVFEIFGLEYDEHDLSHEKFLQSVHPDDIDNLNEVYSGSLESDEGFYELEHRIIHGKTGEVKYVYEHCVHLADSNGKYVHSVGVVQDITERYVAQQKLVDKQAELNAMLEIVADGMVTIDEMGTICSFNQRAERLFGYFAQEIIGQNVKVLMPKPYAHEHDGYIARFIKTSEAKIIGAGREVEGLHRDGHSFAMHLSVAELPTKKGEKRRFIGSCMDLTDIKQKEEIIARSQKMDALGKLTGGIAHDFNNMLGVILGYAQLLKDQLQHDAKLNRYAEQIYHAGERGAKLTGKLLSFSRRRATTLTCTNLNQLIENEADVLVKSLTARVQLDLRLYPLIWTVKIDESGFEDMLLNLAINAMHAIEGNGVITIETDNISLNQLQAAELDLVMGDHVRLRVKDTGCGMDNEVVKQIFDPFYTTKGDGGTGLGLSQVYGFVRAANGSIRVDSTLGSGTEFTVFFPREIGGIETDNSVDDLNILDTRGDEAILVVDDETSLTEVAESILMQHGYQVYCANSAEQALKVLEQHPIDLMLTDIIMPVTNGYQLAKMVNERFPHVLVRLISGFSGHENEPDSELPLDEPIIAKPYTAIELTRAIRVQLNKQLVMERCYELADAGINDAANTQQAWLYLNTSQFEQLDQDHIELFDIFYQCTRLEYDNVDMLAQNTMLEQLVARLLSYCKAHFRTEEAVMAAGKYPYFDNHRRVHHRFIEQLEIASHTYAKPQLQAWLQSTLADWISEHVMVMDKAVYPFIQQHRHEVEQVLMASTFDDGE